MCISLKYFAGLLVILLCSNSLRAAQQKKVNKGVPIDSSITEKTTDKDYADFAKLKEVIGILKEFDLKSGEMVLTLEGMRSEPNPRADPEPLAASNRNVQRIQELLQEELRAANTATNPQVRQSALLNVQKRQLELQGAIAIAAAEQKKLFMTVKYSKNFELNVQDNVKVARSKLEPKKDDQGAPVKYTADELKKLKSPDISGAYLATSDDLRVGQTVKLYLLPPKKETTKTLDSAENKSAEAKDKQGDPPIMALPGRSIVRMVLITDDPYLPPGSLEE